MVATPDHMGVYMIRNRVTGSYYVGSSVNIKRRWRAHRSALNRGASSSLRLQAAWKRYGEEAFVFELIEIVTERSQLRAREQHWIDFLDTFTSGYNARQKAEGGPEMTLARRENLRAAMTGRTYSEATLDRMRQAAKRREAAYRASGGRETSQETKAKIASSVAKHWTKRRADGTDRMPAEAIEKMGKRMADRWQALTAEQKDAQVARLHTSAVREKISAKLSGRPLSDQHRATISAALKGKPKK